MPRTPDQFPGERIEESILFESGSQFPEQSGEVLYATGTISGSGFFFNEEGVVSGPATSFIRSGSHAALRQLIHLADGGGPFEGFASGAVEDQGPVPFPTASIWYTDSSRTKKIVEQLVTYNGNMTVATEQWKAYDVDGTTVLATVTDTITYQGVFETSRTRTIA